jgi:hypothetical protein
MPALIWVSSNTPGWTRELSANIQTISVKGGYNDPGPSAYNFDHPQAPINASINLQAALSVYEDDPRFYNPLSYIVSGGLILLLLIRIAGAAFTQKSAWIALASLAALTMLPVYHRGYDARLLLLAVPACALLWGDNRWKWTALVLSTIAITATATLPAIAATAVIPFAFLALRGTAPLLLAQLAPLSLLALGVFYLCVYWQMTSVPAVRGDTISVQAEV